MVVAFALLFLFFIQLAGTLVESIYILDLLNTALDEKALGLLFFFSPVLLLFFPKRYPAWLVWGLVGVLVVCRGMTPYLNTAGRLLSSGVGTGAALSLLPLLASHVLAPRPRPGARYAIAAGMALAVGMSVFLRTVNFTVDYSLTQGGGWAGWTLGLILILMLKRLDLRGVDAGGRKPRGATAATFGVLLVLTLLYFSFSAPGVMARWAEGSYAWVVTAVSLLALGWVAVTLNWPDWLARVTGGRLLAWNLAFGLSLVGMLLVQQVPFPPTPASPVVAVRPAGLAAQIPLALTLLLFPVVFVDVYAFVRTWESARPAPRDLVPGLLWGALALVLLVFMNIFTNVWGYVRPVSPFFRGKFWLPFALVVAGISFFGWRASQKAQAPPKGVLLSLSLWGSALLGGVFILTAVFAFQTERVPPPAGERSSLVVMTLNMQQANDDSGEKAYLRQLEVIRRVAPDILALQESDSARVSLNNNDYVRYFASKLGYFSYYGPTPVSGTYGTAILSRFPLENPRTVFSYSDQDEIGTAVVEVEVGGRRVRVYNVHPAGSDTAMMAFAEMLLADSKDAETVIALGDYNLRESQAAYRRIDAVFQNAWMSVYPTGVSAGGLDMSGDKRIDHIFVSPHLVVRNAVYLPPPDSATDHPAHWAEVYWNP